MVFPLRSFFLFGPRQTGKSTWLKSLHSEQAWIINLLSGDDYNRYVRDPSLFFKEALVKSTHGVKWIVLDEIQKIPALLDEVHLLMECTSLKFALSGSSARKLKRGGANLLGGRALYRQMFPFSPQELGESFDLNRALQFGTLPPINELSQKDARDNLRAYTEIYLREEIQMEGLARNIGGFTRFLDLAASYAGEMVNYSSVGKESRLPQKTVTAYYEVLEDTLISFRLESWARSPLKRLVSHPKVYLFDNGVTNALTYRLSAPLEPVVRGKLFEQFMIQQTRQNLAWQERDERMYFWRTNHGAEVDLVLALGNVPVVAVEFKARGTVSGSDLSGFRSFREDWPKVPCFLVCEVPHRYQLDFVTVLPWKEWLGTELSFNQG